MSRVLRNWITPLFFVGLAGCGAGVGVEPVPTPDGGPPAVGSASSATQSELAFELTFSAQLQRIVDSGLSNDPASAPRNNQILALSPEVLTGFMLVENLDSGETESHPWRIRVGEDYFQDTESLTSLNLNPGNYSLTLSVVNGDHQYIGTALHYVDDDSVSNVPMIVKPVLGDSFIDVTVVDSLVELGIEYSPDQIAAAGLQDPSVAISVGGYAEQHFLVNPATGLADGLYFGLPAGNYDIEIELFDQGFLVGKTITSQTAVTVSPGLDISMDIAPLYGVVSIDPAPVGEDANVIVQVPAVIVEAAGGLADLHSHLRVVGDHYPIFEDIVTLTQNADQYEASSILPHMSYEDLTFELTFAQISTGKLIGNCIGSAASTQYGLTASCPLLLHATTSISGNLLSTLAVNVFDEAGLPIPGAVVSIDGEPAAITGDSFFGAAGYSRMFVSPGVHTVSAEFGGQLGQLSYESTPLAVDNIEVVLGQIENAGTLLLQDDFGGAQSGLFAPLDYWYGCIGSGEQQAGPSSNQTMGLWSHQFDPVSNYCNASSALTMHSFDGTEVRDAGGFTVAFDVIWSDIESSEITVGIGEELGNDPVHFLPSATADVTVSFRENEIEVRVYESGILQGGGTHPTTIAASELEHVRVDVQTDSFAAGSPATLRVYVNSNGSFVPEIPFNWDGGSNHIELRGGGDSSTGNSIWVELDNLQIRTR
jgi:hypothetical protein